MRILIVKSSLNYPRASGHDAHAYGMMKALSTRGHEIGLITQTPASDDATVGVNLRWNTTFDLLDGKLHNSISYLQRKFSSYWGTEESTSAKLNHFVHENSFDAVVVIGLGILPCLSQIRDVKRVWYAADEWFLHHWSLVKFSMPSTWKELKHGIIKGFYERSFQSCTDVVWVVSKRDAKFMRAIMGVSNVATIPNGVDVDHFYPMEATKIARSFVFWGRLDFQPNIDAIEWFGENVFLPFRKKHPNSIWAVYGFNATSQVRAFRNRFGFELFEDLPDLRKELSRYQIAVMPFVSGAGIKNKLLEAAALGLPILATPLALNGLSSPPSTIKVCRSAIEWQEYLESVFAQQPHVQYESRNWVAENYSWDHAARVAEASLK